MSIFDSTAVINFKMDVGDAAITAVLGYVIVFVGLILLMAVVIILGKIMVSRAKASAAAPAAVPDPAAPAAVTTKTAAPGTAGEIKLYGTPAKDAAMVMAIVADKMGKPINELRFISIKEVK